MAKRLISSQALDELEGLIEHHRKLQSLLEELEVDAAQFDMPLQETLELSQKVKKLKDQLAEALERLLSQVRS